MKHKLIIPFLLIFCCLSACSKEKEEQPKVVLEVVAGLTGEDYLNLPSAATSASFSVRTPELPIVTSSANWIRGTASSPNTLTNISTIELSIQPNTDSQNDRSAFLTVSAAGSSIQIIVNQEKAQAVVDPDPEEEQPDTDIHDPWINTEPCEISGDSPREVVLSLGAGWNLGNQMDAYSNGVSSETAWGNPKATQALFDALKEAGFSTVRIPVTWLGHIGDAPDYEIDSEWLGRVVELVSMAEKAGLNAIVNMHHDGADSKYWLDIKSAALNATKHEEIRTEITALWTQIAEALKDKGNFLMFEAFNEIHDGGWGWGENRNDGGKQYKCLNEWNQTFVNAVRATGGNNETRWLSVPSYVTNIDLAVNGSFKLPVDPAQRTMVAVHFYEPNDFALNSNVTDWGHTGDNSKKGSAIQDEDYMTSQFAKLTENFVNKGIPVYIGENGSPNQATERGKAFRNYYLEYLNRAARDAGLATFYWDNGAIGSGPDKFGMFNHGDGSVINDSHDAIRAILTGATCRDESYTLQSIYNSAPQF